MTEKRRYELRRRAEQRDETRRRIVEATVELHRTVGPAATRVSEVARRAGVQRRTVYNHFPDDHTLFAACSAHWRALHPAPDPARRLGIADPGERVRAVLRDLYSWYRETEHMTANVLRDAELLPGLRGIVDRGLGEHLARVQRLLSEATGVRGRRRVRVEATAAVAVDFHVWQLLASLGDRQAARLAAGFVEQAAGLTWSP